MDEEIKQNELAPATDSQSSLDTVMKALQSKVLGEGGVVSSEDTGFEKAIAGIKEAGEAKSGQLESRWGRDIDYATQQANVGRTQALEGRRGFATQKVALKLLEESNIKYINDLKERRDDALEVQDTATAEKILGMQIAAKQFEQTERQNYFSNLLSVGNMAMGHAQLQEQIKMNAQSMSQFEWQKTMDQASVDFNNSKFDYEKIHNKAILNLQEVSNKLREQEMLLKYGDDPNKIQPDEGFASVDWQMQASTMITPMQIQLAKDVEDGIVGKDEIEDEMDRIIRRIRNLGLPEEAAGDDAIRKMLSLEQEEEEPELPGTVPAWQALKGAVNIFEAPGQGLVKFFTGKDVEGVVTKDPTTGQYLW